MLGRVGTLYRGKVVEVTWHSFWVGMAGGCTERALVHVTWQIGVLYDMRISDKTFLFHRI
jgi:hypothetical protein